MGTTILSEPWKMESPLPSSLSPSSSPTPSPTPSSTTSSSTLSSPLPSAPSPLPSSPSPSSPLPSSPSSPLSTSTSSSAPSSSSSSSLPSLSSSSFSPFPTSLSSSLSPPPSSSLSPSSPAAAPSAPMVQSSSLSSSCSTAFPFSSSSSSKSTSSSPSSTSSTSSTSPSTSSSSSSFSSALSSALPSSSSSSSSFPAKPLEMKKKIKDQNRVMFTSAKEMADFIAEKDLFLDACFVDPFGQWHHCTFAPSQAEEHDIKRGFAFDGSSIRLFGSVEASDMLMVPDFTTCWLDPFIARPTLHVTCSITNPVGELYSRCPRNLAMRAVEFMKSTGIADTAYFGPEAEFFVFSTVSYETAPNSMFFEVDHDEAPWSSKKKASHGEGKNMGHRFGAKQCYFPVLPVDKNHDLRDAMLDTMEQIGIPIEKHHHEVASCQHELGYTCRPLVESADLLMSYKYVVKNEALRRQLTATFMPKPIYGDNGSGMHCHQSLWADGRNLFFDPAGAYMRLSKLALHYIAGLLHHAPAVLAFTNSTVNSYKRLVPGFEAPVNLVYSKGNRSAAIRIPLTDADVPKAKRIEFRCPDGAGNPYLAYSAMLMAGLDGIRAEMTPPSPTDCDLYELFRNVSKGKEGPMSAAERERLFPSTPHRLEDALDALEHDHQFLLEGGVFTKDFIDAFIAYKREEAKVFLITPTPIEYSMYYAC